MSNENININTTAAASKSNPGLLKEMGASLAFSGAITGFGGLTSAVRNRGAVKAMKACNVADFRVLNESLKKANKDVFTRGVELSQNYDAYKQLAKNKTHLENMVKAAQKRGGKISKWESFKNLFRSADNKVTYKSLKESLYGVTKQDGTVVKGAAQKLKEAQTTLKSGGDIIEDGAKLIGKSKSQTVGNLFKSELKNKFVLGITILGAVPRIKEEVIPAFKNEGFNAGIKATGKVIARTAADFVSNAGFSAVGRAIGGALGSVVPGVGSAIGGMFGDVIGSFFSMKLTEKVFDKNKKQNQVDKEVQPQVQQQDKAALQAQQREQIMRQTVQNATPEATQGKKLDLNSFDTTDDFKTARAKYTGDLPVNKAANTASSKPKSAYVRPQNGIYKTQWVNEMSRARKEQQQNKADFTV